MARSATSASSIIKSYQRYRADARAAMIDIFRDELPIRERLERIYAVALDIYLSGEAGPRGCFTVMTAASEAVSDPDIRAMVLEGFAELDKAFAACFRHRQGERRIARRRPIRVVLAQLASATIHTIAIRARARRAAQGTRSDREGRDRRDGARDACELMKAAVA